jgi:3-hydroxyacyl-CoA dehydrogenase
MQIQRVGVLGCGLMGSGIAQVCAAAGYKTVVWEVDEKLVQKGLTRIGSFLAEGIARGEGDACRARRDAPISLAVCTSSILPRS